MADGLRPLLVEHEMTCDSNTDSGAHTLIAPGRSALAGGAQTVCDTSAEIGHANAVAVDARRGSVATRLDDVAHALHDGADSVATTAADVGRLARGAADTVESAARSER
jgi:hypothetical protein